LIPITRVSLFFLLIFLLLFSIPSFSQADRTIRVQVWSEDSPDFVTIYGQFAILRVVDAVQDSALIALKPGTPIYIQAHYPQLTLRIYDHLYQLSQVKLEPVSPFGLVDLNQPGRRSIYRGTLVIVPAGENRLAIYNDLSLEEYLKGVLPTEILPGWPIEALKAQAIVSRTYAIKNRHRHAETYADFCDNSHCQVYNGYEAETFRTSWAVDATRGQFITYQGEPAEVFFHSTCGGITARADEIWMEEYFPYLVNVYDSIDGGIDACAESPHYQWTYVTSRQALHTALQDDARTDPGRYLTYISIREINQSGRVASVDIVGEQRHTVNGWILRQVLSRVWGWESIKSSRFHLVRDGDQITFTGKGLGHGVGLCQYGAKKRAEAGYTASAILQVYFPYTKLATVSSAASHSYD